MRVIVLGSAAGGGLRVLAGYAGGGPGVLPEGSRVALAGGGGGELGVPCPAVPVARRPPRYARQATAGTYDVALRLSDQKGATLAYVPTAGAVDDAVRSVARGADLLLFDGTFWSEGEPRAARAGAGAPTARPVGPLHLL